MLSHHNLRTTNTLLRESLYTGTRYQTYHHFYVVQNFLKLIHLWNFIMISKETCSYGSYLKLEHLIFGFWYKVIQNSLSCATLPPIKHHVKQEASQSEFNLCLCTPWQILCETGFIKMNRYTFLCLQIRNKRCGGKIPRIVCFCKS